LFKHMQQRALARRMRSHSCQRRADWSAPARIRRIVLSS